MNASSDVTDVEMIRFRRQLPALGALVAGGAAVVLLRDNLTIESTAYDAAAAGMMSQSLVLAGPFAGAAAAFQSARLVKLERMIVPIIQPLWARIWRAAVPGVLIVAAGFVLTLAMTGYRGVPKAGMLASSLFVGVGVCVLGAIFGRQFRDYIAVPAMFIGTFIWFSFATAVEPFWLRHVSGALQCCLLDAELPWRAAVAPPLFTLGLVIAAWSALANRRSLSGAVPAVGLVLCFGAWSLVRGLGFAAEDPRRVQQVCDAGAPTICSWPEHAGHMKRLLPEVRGYLDTLSAVGVDVPSVVAEARRDGARGGWAWSADPRLDPDGMRLGLAQAVASGLLPVVGCSSAPAEPTDVSVEPIVAVYAAWVAATMGVSSEPVRSAFGDGANLGAEKVRTLLTDGRRRWLDEVHVAVPRCWISSDELHALLAPAADR